MAPAGVALSSLTSSPAAHYPNGSPVLDKLLQRVLGLRGGRSRAPEPPSAAANEAVESRDAHGERPLAVTAKLAPGRRSHPSVTPAHDSTRRAPAGADPHATTTPASSPGRRDSPVPASEDEVDSSLSLLREMVHADREPGRPIPLPDLQPGQLFGRGRFRVESLLGRGGMGAVYRARDIRLGRAVALKVLTHEDGNDEMRQRFFREARVLCAVAHPNVATIYDVGEDAGRDFFAMELVDGLTLKDLLRREGALPATRALDIALQLARGIAKVHEAGILHRDLKPGNVMISREGVVKLLDFGIARLARNPAGEERVPDHVTLTLKGQPIGTPAYMSPEQARGEEVDLRSDVFSFGVVLYEMVTAISPFRRSQVFDILDAVQHDGPEPPSRIDARLPVDLDTLIRRCLEKDRDQRYASGTALLNALEGRPSATPAPATDGTTTLERHRDVLWLISIVVGLALGGFAAWPKGEPSLPANTVAPTDDGATASSTETESRLDTTGSLPVTSASPTATPSSPLGPSTSAALSTTSRPRPPDTLRPKGPDVRAPTAKPPRGPASPPPSASANKGPAPTAPPSSVDLEPAPAVTAARTLPGKLPSGGSP